MPLADAVGDRRAQNQPGTDQEYPNWRLPLADGVGLPVLLEDLITRPRAISLRAGGRRAAADRRHTDGAGTAREQSSRAVRCALADRVRRGAFPTADAAARRGGRR